MEASKAGKARSEVKKERQKKEAMIRARIESNLKEDVEKIFVKLGLSTTEAITLFYNQVRMYRGLPFRIFIPNEETLEAMKDVKEGKNIVKFESMEEAFEYLGI